MVVLGERQTVSGEERTGQGWRRGKGDADKEIGRRSGAQRFSTIAAACGNRGGERIGEGGRGRYGGAMIRLLWGWSLALWALSFVGCGARGALHQGESRSDGSVARDAAVWDVPLVDTSVPDTTTLDAAPTDCRWQPRQDASGSLVPSIRVPTRGMVLPVQLVAVGDVFHVVVQEEGTTGAIWYETRYGRVDWEARTASFDDDWRRRAGSIPSRLPSEAASPVFCDGTNVMVRPDVGRRGFVFPENERCVGLAHVGPERLFALSASTESTPGNPPWSDYEIAITATNEEILRQDREGSSLLNAQLLGIAVFPEFEGVAWLLQEERATVGRAAIWAQAAGLPLIRVPLADDAFGEGVFLDLARWNDDRVVAAFVSFGGFYELIEIDVQTGTVFGRMETGVGFSGRLEMDLAAYDGGVLAYGAGSLTDLRWDGSTFVVSEAGTGDAPVVTRVTSHDVAVSGDRAVVAEGWLDPSGTGVVFHMFECR